MDKAIDVLLSIAANANPNLWTLQPGLEQAIYDVIEQYTKHLESLDVA